LNLTFSRRDDEGFNDINTVPNTSELFNLHPKRSELRWHPDVTIFFSSFIKLLPPFDLLVNKYLLLKIQLFRVVFIYTTAPSSISIISQSLRFSKYSLVESQWVIIKN